MNIALLKYCSDILEALLACPVAVGETVMDLLSTQLKQMEAFCAQVKFPSAFWLHRFIGSI